MTTDNNFRVKNGVLVGNGNVATDSGSGLNLTGLYVGIVSTSTYDIDLYTNNWSGDGVEVWLRHGHEVQINTDNGNQSWQFKNDGTQGFPTLTTPHAGTGQTLRFTDPTKQVVITNSTATETYPNSTRIVVQGSEGYSSGGEGGDIYLWAGNSGAGGGSGGDIKIDAGQGYSDSEGGTIKIRAGGSDGGIGGFVDIHGGQGVDAAGPVRIYSGDNNQQLQIDNAGTQVFGSLGVNGMVTATQFLAVGTANNTTGYQFQGEPGQDTGMFSEAQGEIQFYNNASITMTLNTLSNVVVENTLIAENITVGTVTIKDYSGVLTPTTLVEETVPGTNYGDFFMNYETGFVDLTSNSTISGQANATTSTSVVKYGTASGYFGGMNSYVDNAASVFNVGTGGDWTWDSWVYINSDQGNEILFSFANNDSLELQWASGAHSLAVYSNVDGFQSGYHAGSISVGTWHHVVLMKASGVYYYGLDGVMVTGTGTGINIQSPMTLGLSHRGPYGSDIYLDMTRWTASARFSTAGYTTPDEASYNTGGGTIYVATTSSIAVSTATVSSIKFPDNTIQTTAFDGDLRIDGTWLRNKDTGDLYISPQDGTTGIYFPSDTYSGSTAVQLFNSNTGTVQINSAGHTWTFNNDGSLTTPGELNINGGTYINSTKMYLVGPLTHNPIYYNAGVSVGDTIAFAITDSNYIDIVLNTGTGDTTLDITELLAAGNGTYNIKIFNDGGILTTILVPGAFNTLTQVLADQAKTLCVLHIVNNDAFGYFL